ncbi:MAG: 1-deoxy-D-xylulose-5-phosphate reductoisomerase [Lachnospiraceae bacterium]|jgi:1-deoxy-D-xylulose-5-phosphate reductoisomerase|nr:1-deoxy-D-xylulose-5-phosphate reductoisomerase [Lachnospiraceae bacterium]MDD6580748.1 1-deoxy-D-xylulose-5-phosphate reductoisomerase [Lachnospiraceae bacterium]MDY5639955.1 1-deoxy-D-xylulose-5-phosphate reductoisomerase [Lachnospiraceae bacterium]
MKNIAVLGSTGSIGTQTLDIVRNNTDELKIKVLAAGSNVELIEKQIREFKPEIAVLYNAEKANELKIKIADTGVKVLSGMDGMIEAATFDDVDTVVTSMVGMIGIKPTIAAIKAGKNIALANKETLVTAGHIIMPLIKEHKVSLLPVDSEHSAIFQSMNGENRKRISKILLTASGGPFRGKSYEELKNVTLEDALKHPNWAMGQKITVDSATLVNKGLEVMEAAWLFDVDVSMIQVVVHPQSVIHSMVEYEDTAVIAQLGCPDMRLPIQYALFYPDRRFLDAKKLDFFEMKSLTFEKPDMDTFKGLKFAMEAAEFGGSMPTVFNASNEEAVAMFLNKKIGFLDIYRIIEESMNRHTVISNPDIDTVLSVERDTREFIRKSFNKG